MQVAVIGIGHVGLVTAGALVRWGHDVIGFDIDQEKLHTLAAGRMPFFEPGLHELVQEGITSGQLRFTSSLADALGAVEVAFVCVGTPPLPGGGPDLSYVEAVGRAVAQHARGDLVLVEKSTVPANTGNRLRQVIEREQRRSGNGRTIDVASNPEFLKEGSAVEDTLHPDRIVYGTWTTRARDVLRRVYEPLVTEDDCPVIETDVASAELIKHASNAFLATRISFMNAVARVAEKVGADVHEIARGMGLDARIGPAFLRAGLGYGGSCFPKDVDAFAHLARAVGYEFELLEAVRTINNEQRELVISKLEAELWHLADKQITLLGAAFKPGTDDLREAPAIYLAQALLEAGASVSIYDPVALEGVRQLLPEVKTFEDPLEACRNSHAVVVTTEWPQVCSLDRAALLAALAYPVVIDARNVFDPDDFITAGARYHSIGRRSVEVI